MLVCEVVADMHHLLGSDLCRQDIPVITVFICGINEETTAVFLLKQSSNQGYTSKY